MHALMLASQQEALAEDLLGLGVVLVLMLMLMLMLMCVCPILHCMTEAVLRDRH